MKTGFWIIDRRWYCRILWGMVLSGIVFSTVRKPRRYWEFSAQPLKRLMQSAIPKPKANKAPEWVASVGAYWHRVMGPLGYFRVFAHKGISNQAGIPMTTGHYRTGRHGDYLIRWSLRMKIA